MDMTALLSIFLVFLALIVAIPATVLFLEITAAILLSERNYSISSSEHEYGHVAVVVPAHNESTGLLSTLLDLRVQLNAHDRLLVVADNCSDDTADVARAAGAEVIERDEPDRKGKGFALAYAISYLKADPPHFVIFADADCRVERGVIHTLASICAQTNRPVQSFSSMVAPSNSPLNTRVAEFAWRVKNYLRPRGLSAMGLPCQLMGCGMAFPWEVICNANLASASIVEDLKLGIDLALAGHPAIFCSYAGMVSEFPTTPEGLQTQRARWEKGHINIIVAAWPRLMLSAIANRNLQLSALALDLAIPPLSLLGMLVVAVLAITALARCFGAPSASMFIALGGFLALVGSVFLAWLRYGRSILPPSSLISILPYIARKFGLYRSIMFSISSSDWIRTDRTKGPK
jgi:cellulose synthase/poly-beta-1,6-N-acetylglucosamine synthase-like glycosyltransferase